MLLRMYPPEDREKLEQKLERLKFEYLVEFEGGLRPYVHVYGVNNKTKVVYGANACIGAVIQIGDFVMSPTIKRAEKDREEIAAITRGINLTASLSIERFKEPIPEGKNWEEDVQRRYRESNCNVIKIQTPRDIKLVIQRHAELYKEQFRPLAERFGKLFLGFVGDHPGYDYPS